MTADGAWGQVETVLLAHHHKPDLQASRALYAAIAAHRLNGQPVWPMLVAPPGSLKTELLEALDGLPRVHAIDKITPNTFISGQIRTGKGKAKQQSSSASSASLLHRIGPDGIIAYPDFSTILSMGCDKRGEVLADMRRIYDGHLRKEYGTTDAPIEHEWSGRITFAVGTTPDVDGHYSIFQTLGERFVMVRWPRAGGVEAAVRAMNQDCPQAKRDLKAAVHALFNGLPSYEPQLEPEMQRKIAALTEFAVCARTYVPRDGYNKEILYLPEPESATRLAQELAQLAKGSALLGGRQTAGDEDYKVTQRVAFDCISATRRKILGALIAGRALNSVQIPGSTLSYAIEDLESLGLVVSGALAPSVVDLLRIAGVLP